MLLGIGEFRKTQGAAQVVWSAGNLYSTLVGICFEMTDCNTEEFAVYYDEDKCHMTDKFGNWHNI